MRHLLILCFLTAACSPDNSGASYNTPGVQAPDSAVAVEITNVNAAPLDSLDFVVGEISPGTDSLAVLSRLGRPERVSTSEGPNGETLTQWHYPDLVVHLFDTPGVSAIEITGPRYITARKVKVGDSKDTVLKAYGASSATSPASLRYCHRRYDDCVHLVGIEIESGRVASIYVGNVLD